jgi:hypothetical protein
MAIVGDELNEYVIKQINQRQKAHGSGQNGDERTLEELTYLNSKTSWIKFASGVAVTEEKLSDLGFAPGSAEISELVGNGLAQKYVLYNGISTLTDINDTHYRLRPFSENGYEVSSDYGIIPTPGITDLDIKALNRGSLKKATIKLKVQDRSQLSIIDTLYMRLGYTVLLEWGNSVFLDNDGNLDTVKETVVERRGYFFSDNGNGAPYTEILKRIEYYRGKYCGNYDGMLGKISNFSWAFNPDGSYDVDLTVISWGDVIESLKSNVTADKKTIDFVEDTPIPSQEGTIVNTKRKDNILFSMLHAMKYVASSTTGKGGNITIDGVSQGNFVSSGSAKIQVKEQKIQFRAKYTLMEWGPGGSFPVESKKFGWKKIENTSQNYDVFRPALQKFPFFDIDYKNLEETIDWEKAPPTKYVVTPPGTKMDQSKGTYTYQEVVTRVAGDPNAKQGDSSFTTAPGISDDMLYFENAGILTSSATKPSTATFTHKISTWYPYEKKTKENNYGNSRSKPFPPRLATLIDYTVSNFNAIKWSDVITSLAINWNHPEWVWGISVDDHNFYAGLTTKWGIDGGTNFDLNNPGLKTTFLPPNPELQKITSINDAKIVTLRAEEFQKFKDANQIPAKLSQPPAYGSDGKPTDNNYEFFHRFVAKDEAESTKANSGVPYNVMLPKPFWWKVEFFDEAPIISQQQFDNPLIDLEFDTKGVFQLNTDPISYYLKFGFLLQILKDKVVFKIDENQTNHKNNTSIFQINDEPGSSEMLCIRSATIGQISYDFRTCIVRRDKFTKPWTDPNDPNQGTQKVFPELDVWANEDNIKITDENRKYTAADTMNVYLNFDFIGRCMESNTDEKGNTSMYGFINSICAGINKSLGGINNLEPIIDETTNTLNIIDTSPKYISSDDSLIVDRNDPYQLQLYGYTPQLNLSADVEKYYPTQVPHYESTFARKVNLKTAITPEYATMITVGAAAGGYVKGVEATSFAKWNNGIIDRFKQNLIPASKPPSLGNLTGTNPTGSTLNQSSIEDTLIAYQQVMTKSPNCFGIVP